MKSITVFLAGNPPRTTAQQKKACRTASGIRMYEPPTLKAARLQLHAGLRKDAPAKPLDGPIRLTCTWEWEPSRKKDSGKWKLTRPDTDNLQKLLKDVMTECGYWHDDAQVVSEHVQKRWNSVPGLTIQVEQIDAVSQ